MIAVVIMLAPVSKGRATDTPKGPFEPNWGCIRKNYKVPQWFPDAKFGIFIHWGLYAVPAHHNEWYARDMCSDAAITQWHVEPYGPQDKFGILNFIRTPSTHTGLAVSAYLDLRHYPTGTEPTSD